MCHSRLCGDPRPSMNGLNPSTARYTKASRKSKDPAIAYQTVSRCEFDLSIFFCAYVSSPLRLTPKILQSISKYSCKSYYCWGRYATRRSVGFGSVTLNFESGQELNFVRELESGFIHFVITFFVNCKLAS
jgi:hypothetical protein